MPRKGFASFRKWAMRTLAVLAAPTCSNKKQGMVLRYLPTYFRRQKMDDNITSLQQAKHAFAKENNIEPCTNDKCGFSGCTCGKKWVGAHEPLFENENEKDFSWHLTASKSQHHLLTNACLFIPLTKYISLIQLFMDMSYRCGCNVIATSEMLETCDPCAEFKRKKAAENACKAREA